MAKVPVGELLSIDAAGGDDVARGQEANGPRGGLCLEVALQEVDQAFDGGSQ